MSGINCDFTISKLDEHQFTIITYLLSGNVWHQKHTKVTCTQVIYHFSEF